MFGKSKRKKKELIHILKAVSTKQLVAELKRREGVETIIAEPYQSIESKIEGPAIVMVIND